MIDIRHRLLTIIGAVIGFALLLFGGFWLLNQFDGENAPEAGEDQDIIVETETPTQAEDVQVAVPPPTAAQPAVQLSPDELQIRQTVRIFVERFGSFSNQNDNVHIEDALVLATAKMGSWIETQLIEQSEDYEGKTTQVIAVGVENIDGEAATASADVQEEISVGTETTVQYRTAEVALVKSGGVWKVDAMYWQDS